MLSFSSIIPLNRTTDRNTKSSLKQPYECSLHRLYSGSTNLLPSQHILFHRNRSVFITNIIFSAHRETTREFSLAVGPEMGGSIETHISKTEDNILRKYEMGVCQPYANKSLDRLFSHFTVLQKCPQRDCALLSCEVRSKEMRFL